MGIVDFRSGSSCTLSQVKQSGKYPVLPIIALELENQTPSNYPLYHRQTRNYTSQINNFNRLIYLIGRYLLKIFTFAY